MSSQTQETTQFEYSGQFLTGLDANASYDRLVYHNHERVLPSSEIQELLSSLLLQFQDGDRSRLTVRVLVDSALNQAELAQLTSLDSRLEIDLYPDHQQRFQYLTMALNRADRALDDSTYNLISQQVRARVSELMADHASFEADALAVLDQARQDQLTPTLQLQPDELMQIWQPFGWSRDAVESVLSSANQNLVMGMRDQTGELMAAAFFSDQSHGEVRHGETTEWTVSPINRNKGIIRPLLLIFHAHLIHLGVHNIWADLRVPDPVHSMSNSLAPAARSGMTFFTSDQHRFISSNHVTIDGEPQSYNQDSSHQFGDTPGRLLRSFVRGWVDPALFSRQLLDACASMIR